MNDETPDGCTEVADESLKVLEGIEITGDINTPMESVLEHIRHAIRQQHPQFQKGPQMRGEQIILVGSGPSLNETLPELVELVRKNGYPEGDPRREGGFVIVTVNGAYHWCLEHNFRVGAQIVLDAKPSTARFLDPAFPGCTYYVASQCHPDVWATVRDRENVYVWHSINPKYPESPILNSYYGKGQWTGVSGGTTVLTRALTLLYLSGYVKFHLFGVDCCWLDGQHHAFDQPENVKDRRYRLKVTPSRGDVPAQTFECAPWHVKQFEDLLQMIRVNGESFLLRVHGPGLLATALEQGASVAIEEAEQPARVAPSSDAANTHPLCETGV